MPDQSLSLQGESRGSASSVSNTTVDYITLVFRSTGTVGGTPLPAGQPAGSGSTVNGSGVSHETESSSTDCLAYLSYSSQGLSSEGLQTSCLPHGGIKPILTMVPPLLNDLAGVSDEGEISFLDLWQLLLISLLNCTHKAISTNL